MSESIPSWAVPGAKVVFLGHRKMTGGSLILLEAGRVYTIRETFFHSLTSEPGVRVREVQNPRLPTGRELGYPLVSFRPVVTRSQEQDVAIFRPILDQVPVDA